MRLKDILDLKAEPESLNRIRTFLEEPRSHVDYQAAYSRYFSIALDLSLNQLVVDEGGRVIKEIENQRETEYQERILKHLIEACLRQEIFDQAKSYIEKRKALLPVMRQYEGILDEVSYKKALGQPYLEDLIRITTDVVPDPVRIRVYEEMFRIYRDDKDYEKALDCIHELYRYDLEHAYINEELYCLVALERYDEARTRAGEELKRNKDNVIAVETLIRTYMHYEDYHKAMTLEAEYEEIVDQADNAFKVKYFELLVELYASMGNKLSHDVYRKKLSNAKRALERKREHTEEKPKQAVVVEPVTDRKASRQTTLEHFELINEMILFSHRLDDKKPLREYLRMLFIRVFESIDFKDLVVYLDQSSPNLFHFKKERLYDKTIGKEQIADTVQAAVLEGQTEIHERIAQIKWKKNILTQKDFDEKVAYAYSFPMGKDGVFTAFFAEAIPDPERYYDVLRVLANVIHAHVLNERKNDRLKRYNRFYEAIIDTSVMMLRYMDDTTSTYNETAQAFFGVDRHHHLEIFLRDVSSEYVSNYKKAVRTMFNKADVTKTITYRFQDKHVLERMHALRIDERIHVVSAFYDLTDEVERTKELIEKATVDDETELLNRRALSERLDDHLKDKASLCLIELDMHLKHIYGSEAMRRYFKEFSQVSKKYFEGGTTYRFDFNQILVIIDRNDIRAIKKLIRNYLRAIENHVSQVLPYETFQIKVGIVRYPVVTFEKRKDKLFRYLGIALEKAKRIQETDYVFFNYSDYEDDVFEQHVIDRLNEAIENRTLELSFKQITDLERNRVWQYESELGLPNLSVDSKYFLTIARKRHRIKDLEHFHIESVCAFLSGLEKETERLVKITIPISRETFLDPKFNPLVFGLLQRYAIPYAFIRFKFEMELRPNQYATQIQELIDHGISLDTTSLEMALAYPFHALHIGYPKGIAKKDSYLKKVKEMLEEFNMALVLRDVDTKDHKEDVKRLGLRYAEGDIYRDLPADVLLEKIKESL
ncbi:MAG: EAL domain-containing protein [Acholeplasmataceae bacterium]